ncbi:MAG: tetratricopeptide repeat protein [Verrucomicrobiales bacterium]
MVILWGLLSTETLASQSDKRLDPLFKRLQATLSKVEAQSIEMTIWRIWVESDQDKVNNLMNSGIAAMGNLDYATALKVFDKMVAIAPHFAEGWNKRATIHYLQKDFAASIKDIKRTLNLEPRHFGALSGLGLVLMEMEQYDSALRAFKDALKVNPHLRGAKANVDALRKLLGNVQI